MPITWKGPTDTLIEQANSPQVEAAERWTVTRTYKGLYTLCRSSIVPRGTGGTGDEAGYICAKSTVTRERGNIGTLTVVWEATAATSGAQLPLPRFSCQPQRIARPLKYNVRYAALAPDILDAIDKALEADSLQGNGYYDKLSGTERALELFNKRKRGQETYYLAGLKYTYTYASWTLPTLTLGGFLDTPDGPMEGLLPGTSTWLREADGVDGNGSYYEITCSWIGGPSGDWDTDLY